MSRWQYAVTFALATPQRSLRLGRALFCFTGRPHWCWPGTPCSSDCPGTTVSSYCAIRVAWVARRQELLFAVS